MSTQRQFDERHYGSLYEKDELAWSARARLDGAEYIPCVYCGDVSTEADHVMPISRIGGFAIDEIRHLLILVPACSECNHIASNTVDASVEDRKDRVQAVLLKRYKRLLSAPDWTVEELEELEGRLRDEIALRQRRREWLKERISY